MVALDRATPSFAAIAENIARDMNGETLLPIIRNECQIVGWNL
jgi:hypothetical protein